MLFPLDIFILVLFVVLMFLNVAIFIIAFALKKKYLPLRAKNLPLVGLFIFGSFNAYLGYMLGPLHILNPLLPKSVIQSYFNPMCGDIVHGILGVYVWGLVFVLRHKLLYRVLIQNGRFSILKSIIIPVLYLYLPVLIYNVVIVTAFQKQAFEWNEQAQDYIMKTWAFTANFAVAGILIALIAYYNYQLRSVIAVFNEYHITFWVLVFCIVYTVLNIARLTIPNHSKTIAYIIFFWILIFSQFWFFFIMLIHVYKYFF